jgi:hypothetical protein
MYTFERIKRHAYTLLIISDSTEIDPIGTLRFATDNLIEIERWENLIKTHLNDSKPESIS